MGVNLILPNGPSEEVLDGPSIGNGQWYRIGKYDGSSSIQSQASAEFILSDGNANRNTFVRLRASPCYSNSNSSLLLEEYSCWDTPALSLMRMCSLNNSSGDTLEVWGNNPNVANMRLRVKHQEFFPGGRWTPVNFEPIPATPTDASVYMRRGIGPTGNWRDAAMLNNWVRLDTNWNIPGYRMLPGSLVELRGVIKGGTISGGTPVLNLPIGYRPTLRQLNVCVSSDAIGRIDVSSNGDVYVTVGSTTWASLDNIRFLAEN